MAEQKHRYFTTPIYYPSAKPHLGSFYANVLENVLARHYAHRGEKVLTLTGLDEHGEKIERKAKDLGKTVHQYVDELAEVWKSAMAECDIGYDIFLRTTDKKHIDNVTSILNRCYQKGDIYFGEHEGYYCVDCEAFLTPKELDDNKFCLVHKKATEVRKEGNYFFKLLKYKDELIRRVKAGEIVTQRRYINELLGVIESFDTDLSISRPKSRTTWGIDLPFDDKHVTYVWFDALPNYVTGVGGLDAAKTSPYWANCNHILGKDILKFHGLFWPAMLLSLELPLPRLIVTGWILSGKEKMSKSLGNVLSPDIIKRYGPDAFTNAAFRLAEVGEDIELTVKLILERYNADLANGVGNLLARTLGMIEKYFAKKIPSFHEPLFTEEEKALAKQASELPSKVTAFFDELKVDKAMNETWSLISTIDKYISDSKPWTLAKGDDPTSLKKLENILAHSIAVLRTVGLVASAYFPKKMQLLLGSIGEAPADSGLAFERARSFYKIQSGFVFNEIPRLYDRVDIGAEMQEFEKQAEATSAQPATPSAKESAPRIGFDHFAKVEMTVGTVIKAELVEGSDKLLKLQVSLGDCGQRQILSGIRQWVKPEEIANRKVIIVTNLEPRKMRFGVSEGMLLSAETSDGAVSPVYVPEALKEGAKLS